MALLRRRTPPSRVTLVTRVGCTLCAKAEPVVQAAAARAGVAYDVQDVDTDLPPAERARWTDKVPVVLLDGVEHAFWQVDEKALRRALQG